MTPPFTKTRLAPSPTGALHLGHARTFLIAWWMARQAGAQIFMRMEDLDAGRAKPESVQQAYDDLRWLGMDWDPYETNAGGDPSKSEVVQSERMKIYDAVLQSLWEKNAIYPCICSRAQILAAVSQSASAPHEGEIAASLPYPGTCRNHPWPDPRPTRIEDMQAAIHAATGRRPCWRLRIHDGLVQFHDLIAGPQSVNVRADAGDFPLTRFDGTPAYQLACVVDDLDMGIDCVIRGDDLLSSTPRQILVYHALSTPSPPRLPLFAHAPLVIGFDGKRLAKRHGESRIAQFREASLSPEKVVGWVAWRSGQIDTPREISANEVLRIFDLRKLPPHRILLTDADLAWLR